MLVLARKKQESIVIGENVVITVLEFRNGRVRLGIEAPREISIHRQEIVDAVGALSGEGLFELASPAGESGHSHEFLPGVQEIAEIVQEAVSIRGGHIRECSEFGNAMFLRATIAMAAEVKRNDAVENGIALKVSGPNILLHHFLFRRICKNGAIGAQMLHTARFQRLEFAASTERISAVIERLHEAVEVCLAAEHFERSIDELKTAARREADLSILWQARLDEMLGERALPVRRQILRRFHESEDRSLYGLMNAVTSVARDETKPELKWRLEELGGGVPALAGRPNNNNGDETQSAALPAPTELELTKLS